MRSVVCLLFFNGLERSCVTDLIHRVLEGDRFPPRLTHGLERSFSAPILCCVAGVLCLPDDCYTNYVHGLERSLGACALGPGVVMSGWMVLKGIGCNPPISSVVLCHQYSINGLERILWGCCLSSQ